MQYVAGLVPSLSGFVFINDPASTLRELLAKIQKKDQHPMDFMRLAFEEVGKINSQKNVSTHLRNIAEELIHQILRLDGLTDIHEAICTMPFKNSPLLLDFEKACHLVALTSPHAKAKLISGSLLTRLKNEEIEREAAFSRARDDFFAYVNDLSVQIQLDPEEVRAALNIMVMLQNYFEGFFLFNFLFQGTFSKEMAEELLQALHAVSKNRNTPKPIQDEIVHTLTHFHHLPCTEDAALDRSLVIDRLRVSSFWHHRADKFSSDIMLYVAGAFSKLKTAFKAKQDQPYHNAFLECLHWHVNQAATSSPILPLEIFVKALHHLPRLFSHKFLEACFPASFFHRLELFLQKDTRDERDVYHAFRRLDELTEKGFNLFQGLFALFPDKLKGYKFLNTIFARFAQAEQADFSDFEDRGLRKSELFKMCYAIELVLPNKHLFKKDILVIESYLTPFSRQLVFDFLEETVGICAKKVLGAPGSSKRTTPILKLPIDCTLAPTIRARGVSRVRASTVQTLEGIREEFHAMNALEGAPHIVQAHSVYEYRAHVKTAAGQQEYLRGVIESDKYTYNGDDLSSGKVNLLFIKVVQLIKDFVEGVYQVHNTGCIHGDVKPGNFVFNVYHKPRLDRKVCVSVEGAVCDLGYLSSAQAGQPLPRIKSALAPFVQPKGSFYNLGFTGTPAFTSPEHFAELNFNGDHFQSEVFSLGVAILAMLDHKLPEWVDIIDELIKDIDMATMRYKTKTPEDIRKAQETMKQLVRQNINNNPQFHNLRKRKRLKEKLTQGEELIFLLFSMLLVEPGERITIEKLRIEIRKILISNPPRRKVVRMLTPKMKSLSDAQRVSRLRASSRAGRGAKTLKRMQELLKTPLRKEEDEKKAKPTTATTPAQVQALTDQFGKLDI